MSSRIEAKAKALVKTCREIEEGKTRGIAYTLSEVSSVLDGGNAKDAYHRDLMLYLLGTILELKEAQCLT